MDEQRVSVVVISHNEGEHLRMTVDAMRDTTPASAEIVIVDDFSADASTDFLSGPGYRDVRLIRPDTRLGISAARNLGAEYSLRLWLSGYRCVVQPASDIAHLFRTKFPYQVEWESTTHNQLRTALLHLSRPRCQRVFEQARGNPRFELALARLFDSGLDARRQFCSSIRKHTDDAVFDLLAIPGW